MSTSSTDISDQSVIIGARIREERKHLGLSQAAFAAKVGVHRRTQVNYESGERRPDTDYLAALATAGGDVGYVLTGESEFGRRQAYKLALDAIRVELELFGGHDEEWGQVLQLLAIDWKNFGLGRDRKFPGCSAITALLKKSPVLMLDTRLLEDVIEKLEFVLDAKGVRLSPSEKASAILCLFREAKKPGAQLGFKAVEAITSRFDSRFSSG